MEPIGTITQYFSFIDDQTRNILESTMNEATDYYDFVHRLCEGILSSENPVMVVYFAIHFSMLAMDYKYVDKIREKYGHHQILRPNLFYSSVYQGVYEDEQKVHELADAVIATDPDDWLILEMNLIKFEVDIRNYPKIMYESATMERIEELIQSNPKFGFYEIVLCDFLSIRAQIDGDTEEQFRLIERGIQIAEEFDDRLRKAHLLMRKGGRSVNFDRAQARLALEEAYQIIESSLGIPANYANVIYNLSFLDAIKGDFDRAIELCLKSVNVLERAGFEYGNPSSFLSIYYNAIGDSESGLEWGQMAEDQFSGRPYLLNHARLFQIWALISLKRLIEAQSILDSIREEIVKGGNEDQMAWLHFVSGLLEMEQGDYSLALSSIEQGLEIYEHQGTALLMENIFLRHLAAIEIMSSPQSNVVSPSLAILEERAISEELPGILGQVLLLKAEMAMLNNDDILLREILPQLQSLIDENNLNYLRPFFADLQNRL